MDTAQISASEIEFIKMSKNLSEIKYQFWIKLSFSSKKNIESATQEIAAYVLRPSQT